MRRETKRKILRFVSRIAKFLEKPANLVLHELRMLQIRILQEIRKTYTPEERIAQFKESMKIIESFRPLAMHDHDWLFGNDDEFDEVEDEEEI